MIEKDIRWMKNTQILVAPSLLASDFSILADEIKRVEDAGCDLLHLDIMDGHFVPNLTIGPPLVSSIRKTTKLIFDTHLMITDPLKYIDAFVKVGSEHITFHLECGNDPLEVINKIRASGATVGISVKPKTSAKDVIPFLDKVDLVLVMTVEPGFGGQSFMSDMMSKVREIREYIQAKSLKTHLEVDGGIDEKTVDIAVSSGANMLVAGTSVFRNKDGAKKAIESLHKAQPLLDKFK